MGGPGWGSPLERVLLTSGAPPTGWARGAPRVQPMGGPTMRRTSPAHRQVRNQVFASGAAHELGRMARRAPNPLAGRCWDERIQLLSKSETELSCSAGSTFLGIAHGLGAGRAACDDAHGLGAWRAARPTHGRTDDEAN